MSETPQPHAQQQASATGAEVPEQTRGQERITTQAPSAHRSDAASGGPSAWAGWVVFASVMMMVVGAFQAVVGLTALFDSGYYVVGQSGLLVNVDYTAWGWVHVALGALAVAAGVGLLAGQMWARIIGIAMALVSAVVNLAFIAAYPLWSILVIALDVVVIYAIAMHGEELETESR
jgi:hypothetical protein